MYASAYIWARVLRYLERELSAQTVEQWFCDVEVIRLNDRELVLQSSSEFRQDIIRKRFFPLILQALQKEFQMQSVLRFASPAPCVNAGAFRENFTLGSFVVGNRNRFAQAAAWAVSENPPGSIYNPLYLYGPSGVGKTHLLHAIGNRIRSSNPQTKILYFRADDYSRELVEAIRAGEDFSFREKYRNADVLLVDDLQFLAGKEATQEEFFHLFRGLYEKGCQIVLSSDCPPKNLRLLTDRLTQHFPDALIADLGSPDRDTRLEILRREAEKRQLTLSPEQLEYIACHICTGALQLCGVLNILMAQSLQPDMDMVRRAVAEILPSPAAPPDPHAVVEIFCRSFEVTPEQLRSHQRHSGLAAARLALVYLLVELCAMPIPRIAALLDRDTLTITYLLRRADSRMDKYAAFRSRMLALKSQVLSELE